MLDDIKKQIEFIRIGYFLMSMNREKIYFWSFPLEEQPKIQSTSKKLYDEIVKDIEFMDENQFILTYGRDPFSLNEHQNYINTTLEENNAKTSK